MSSIWSRLQALSAEERERYETIVDEFEERWNLYPDQPPGIADSLPIDEPLQTLVLVALVKTDMETRRKRRAPLLAEDYLKRFPALARDSSATAEILSWEHELSSPEADDLDDPGSAGRTLLRDEIGRGGMGFVLRGHDPHLDREVAVKILRKAHADNAALIRRFLEEARILGHLQHPGVVPIYDSGRLVDGRPWFAMRLVDGRTLAALLDERPRPDHDQPRFLAIFEQVCQTLAYAHEKGVIHRDLKPTNIMVWGAFGEVQVMDQARGQGASPRSKNEPGGGIRRGRRSQRGGSASDEVDCGAVADWIGNRDACVHAAGTGRWRASASGRAC